MDNKVARAGVKLVEGEDFGDSRNSLEIEDNSSCNNKSMKECVCWFI